MLFINKERLVSCSVALIFLASIFAATPSWSAKMYKWVDKNGQVHYSQTPPRLDQVKNKSQVSKKSDVSAIPVTRKGDYDYCGEIKLPGPLHEPKKLLLRLGARVDSWTRSLKQSERTMTGRLRNLESENRQYSKYKSSSVENEAAVIRREAAQKINEYKCALAWAKRKKNESSGLKQEMALDLEGAKSNYKKALDMASEDCGYEPKDYVSEDYNERNAIWKKCMRPHDIKIRSSGRNLQNLRSQSKKIK